MTPDQQQQPDLNMVRQLERIETLITAMVSADSDHETRLRRLEKILYVGIGLAASLGSAAGSFVGSSGIAGG